MNEAQVKQLRDACVPFVRFIDAFDAKPIKAWADEFVGTHGGTACEGGTGLRLSELRRLREVLAASSESQDDPVFDALKKLYWAVEDCQSCQKGVDEAKSFDSRGFATGALTSAQSRLESVLAKAKQIVDERTRL